MSEHAATIYARDVVTGRIVAGQKVRWACQRHLDDLDRVGDGYRWRFDEGRVERVLAFCRICRHYKGPSAGERFEPEPWQVFILGCVFGWVDKDTGFRRFLWAYTEVARKNGKTYMLAVIGLYLLVADGEAGAEIYAAATKKDQAKILHAAAVEIWKRSPELRKHVRKTVNNLAVESTASYFRPLGADADTEDGLNVHGAILDETHAHRNRKMFDVLDSATGARDQPLMWMITTAGFDPNLFGGQQNKFYSNALDPDSGIEADRAFIFIATLDEEDDWRDERVWIKANPNLGVSVQAEKLGEAVTNARNEPRARNNVLTKHMNIWTTQVTRWLVPEAWDECGRVEFNELCEQMRGRMCYGGVDLSSSLDLTAFALWFPPGESVEHHVVLTWFWLPQERLELDRYGEMYRQFHASGHLAVTRGSMVDYGALKMAILAKSSLYHIREIAYDPWGATQLAQELAEDGATVVECRQGYRTLSEPSKLLEGVVTARQLEHGGHPVLRECARNVSVITDHAGNIKPSKQNQEQRIDGIAAVVTAGSRVVTHQAAATSVYDERKPLVL